MNKNTCKCVGELAERWIKDILGIEVRINYLDDYSVELQFWNLPKAALHEICNGIEGMCMMYTKLRHLEGEKGYAKQPCIKTYSNETIPRACFINIFTDETLQYALAIGID